MGFHMAWFRKDGVSFRDKLFIAKVCRVNGIDPLLLRKKTDRHGTMVEQRIRSDGAPWHICVQNRALAKESAAALRDRGEKTGRGSDWDMATRHRYLNTFFKVAPK